MSEPTTPKPADTATTTFEWWSSIGEWVEREKTAEELAADDPPELVATPQPAPSPDGVWEPGPIEVVEGIPRTTWVLRPWTPEEVAAHELEADREAAKVALRSIVTDMQAEKARALAVRDNVNATGRERDLARCCLRIADAVIDLVRYVRPEK